MINLLAVKNKLPKIDPRNLIIFLFAYAVGVYCFCMLSGHCNFSITILINLNIILITTACIVKLAFPFKRIDKFDILITVVNPSILLFVCIARLVHF